MRNYHTNKKTEHLRAKQLQQERSAWDQVYEGGKKLEYERFAQIKFDDPYRRRVLEWAHRLRVGLSLEFGCGKGGMSLAVARSLDGFHPVLLDFSSVALDQARELFRYFNQEASLVQTAMPPVPLADATFDLVFGHTVLEHFVPYQEAFFELARVTKPGGIIILTVPNRYRPDGSLWYKKAYRIGYTQREFTIGELHEMCSAAGVEVLESFGMTLFYVDPMMLAWAIGLGRVVERRLGNPLKRQAPAREDKDSETRGVHTTPPGLAFAKTINRAWLRVLSTFNRLDRFMPIPPSWNLVIGIVARKPCSRA